MKKYSKSTKGFYDTGINTFIPADAVDIDQNEYQSLMLAQSSGKGIVPDKNGKPSISDKPETID